MIFHLFDQISQAITSFFHTKPTSCLQFQKEYFSEILQNTLFQIRLGFQTRELSNDCINHSSKQTPSFSTSGILEMTVWPAATTCGDRFCALDTCQQETENHTEHKTAAMCNDLILTYNKELGHVSLFVVHYKINYVGKSLVISSSI